MKETRVGIDRTFNLGNFYVTSFVYKNERVIRKDSSDHPVFLGPQRSYFPQLSLLPFTHQCKTSFVDK